MTYSIRRATSADAALLARLGAQCFYEAFAEVNTPEDMSSYLAASFSPEIQAAELAEGDAVFLIAEDEGALAGYAHLRVKTPPDCVQSARPYELQRFYALKDWWGKGLAQALMQSCFAEAAAKAYALLWLTVWSENPRAIRFYQKSGFRIAGTTTFVLGSDAQTDYVMVRAVSGVP